MKIEYESKQITYCEQIDIKITSEPPKIIYPFDKKKKYTILMVDPDAPYPKNPKYAFWLHWLIINTTDEIMPYNPPNPPKDSDYHRYYILIFERDDQISKNQITKFVTERPNFNVKNFVKKFKLRYVDVFKFKTKQS